LKPVEATWMERPGIEDLDDWQRSDSTDVTDRLRSMADAGTALDAALTESRALLSRHAAVGLGTAPGLWP
jgi:hypothetical protein